MKIIDLLSSSLQQKGNEANIALAKDLAANGNKEAIKDLVENLSNKNKSIQSDCIKTLYETGYLKPDLIADYHTEFLKLLTSKNNRLVWGGMIALSTITELKAREIFSSLDLIMKTINKGSVITTDAGVEILSVLNRHKEFFPITDALLMEQLWKCPIKQLPMYAEKSIISINATNKEIYWNIIEQRISECDKDSQTKRLTNILKKINKL